MNIFFLDKDPKLCSQYHCDKHLVKMVLETAQLLSTAHRVLDKDNLDEYRDSNLYKETHTNHPCSKWLRVSTGNYQWLYQLFVELNREYTHRYGKEHLSGLKLLGVLYFCPDNLSMGELTPPALAMPDIYKVEDPVQSYRSYYIAEKQTLLTYTKRIKPYWIP